jgi:hypothetical protein
VRVKGQGYLDGQDVFSVQAREERNRGATRGGTGPKRRLRRWAMMCRLPRVKKEGLPGRNNVPHNKQAHLHDSR